MSSGTTVNNVWLNRLHKQDAQSDKEDQESLLQMYRDELMILAASTPRDTKDDDGYIERWESYVQRRVGDILEAIEEAAVRAYQCNILMEADEKDVISE